MTELAAVTRTLDLARTGRLYPALILHGATDTVRRETAARIARTLLCEQAAELRPCGECRHCLRIEIGAVAATGAEEAQRFHPDLAVLERDAAKTAGEFKTVTSVDSTRAFLHTAHLSPFEASGQVFVIASAETLNSEAGDLLLKLLEEPGSRSPRHFLLLAPSRFDLAVTLRSRSQALYLGAAESPDPKLVAKLSAAVADAIGKWSVEGNPIHLLAAATVLGAAGKFDDPRAALPWKTAAAAVRGAALAEVTAGAARRALFDLAVDLLSEAPVLRLRGIPADRLLEGMLCRRLAG